MIDSQDKVFLFQKGHIYIYIYVQYCHILLSSTGGIQSHKPSTIIISYMYIFRINNLQLYTSIQTRVKSMSAKKTWNTQPFIYSKKTHILSTLHIISASLLQKMRYCFLSFDRAHGCRNPMLTGRISRQQNGSGIPGSPTTIFYNWLGFRTTII